MLRLNSFALTLTNYTFQVINQLIMLTLKNPISSNKLIIFEYTF